MYIYIYLHTHTRTHTGTFALSHPTTHAISSTLPLHSLRHPTTTTPANKMQEKETWAKMNNQTLAKSWNWASQMMRNKCAAVHRDELQCVAVFCGVLQSLTFA